MPPPWGSKPAALFSPNGAAVNSQGCQPLADEGMGTSETPFPGPDRIRDSPERVDAREGGSNEAVPLQGAVVMPEQPTDGPTLKARHLTRSFGQGDTKATALNDASLDLHGGQIALLMGPSGS